MQYEPFRNLFVTPVLPFDDGGEIDGPAYRAFLAGAGRWFNGQVIYANGRLA